MPTFLTDPSPSLLLVLGATLVVTAGVWWSRRDRKSLVALLAVAGVAGLVFLIDFTIESPREEAVRRVQAMVTAADARDSEAFVSHLAEKFEYRGEGNPVGMTRDQIRKSGFWSVLRQHNVHVAAWDFARADAAELDANTVEIGFLAKGEAEGKPYPLYFRATFARQPDGAMRLTALASFDAMKRQNERKTIPFFP